jgi:hypothetical protein
VFYIFGLICWADLFKKKIELKSSLCWADLLLQIHFWAFKILLAFFLIFGCLLFVVNSIILDCLGCLM